MSLLIPLIIRLLAAGGVKASPLLVEAAIIGLLVFAGGAFIADWHHKAFESGYDRAISDVAADNDAAVGRAFAKRDVLNNCRARGGTWDQTTGNCQ